MSDNKTTKSANSDFKTVPLGFDKNEVMEYIRELNKKFKGLDDEYKTKLKEAIKDQSEDKNEELEAEIQKKKEECDAQILESKKAILDERRRTAQVEKELHTTQDLLKEKNDELSSLKARVNEKLAQLKQPVAKAAVSEEQLAEISKKANNDANAIVLDAQKKADEIIGAAKAYFADTVQKTADYKDAVIAKIDDATSDISLEKQQIAAVAANTDISELLKNVADEVNKAVSSALAAAIEKSNQDKPEATQLVEENDDKMEAVLNAKQVLLNIGGFDESELFDYVAETVEPYDFKLNVEIKTVEPEQSVEELDDLMQNEADDSGILSSFEILTSDTFDETDEVTEDISGDMDDLLIGTAPIPAPVKVPEPMPTPTPVQPAKKTGDDFADFADMFANAEDEDEMVSGEETAPQKIEPVAKTPIVETPKPAPVIQPDFEIDDDLADLLSDTSTAPLMAAKPVVQAVPVVEKKVEAVKPAPIPQPVAEEKIEPVVVGATDDFDDLLMSAEPVIKTASPVVDHKFENNISNINTAAVEKLADNSMSSTADSVDSNNPWKQMEAELGSMTFPDIDDDDDMMASTISAAEKPVEKKSKPAEEKIDMSEYASMLSGDDQFANNTKVDPNAVHYDPAWDFAMTNNDDDDDEMSTDNVGFFDL